MQHELCKVIKQWSDEFPNVVFQHGASTESAKHYIITCDGFETFNISIREKVEAYLRRYSNYYIDNIGAGPCRNGGKNVIFFYLLKRSNIKQNVVRCALLITLSVSMFYIWATEAQRRSFHDTIQWTLQFLM